MHAIRMFRFAWTVSCYVCAVQYAALLRISYAIEEKAPPCYSDFV